VTVPTIKNVKIKNSELAERMKQLYRTLKKWLGANKDAISSHSSWSISYALSNEQELVAVGTIQPKVIEHLVSVTYKDSNLYQELMAIITELIKYIHGTKISP